MVNPLVSILTSQALPGAGGPPSLGGGAGAVSDAGLLGQGGLLAGNPFIQLLLSQQAQTQLDSSTTANQLVAALAQGNSPTATTQTQTTLTDSQNQTDPNAPDLTALAGLVDAQVINQLFEIVTQAPEGQGDDLLTQPTAKNAAPAQTDALAQALALIQGQKQPASDPTTSTPATNSLPATDNAAANAATADEFVLLADETGIPDAPTTATNAKNTPLPAAAATPSPDNTSRLDALKKAFKIFEQPETAASPAPASDKNVLVRAVQAYGGTSNNSNDNDPNSSNDSGLGIGFKGIAAQVANPDGTAFYNNLAVSNGQKVIDPLSSAAVAAKNPVPNSLSHNPTAAEQVSLRVAQALHNGDSRITLHLEPAELGRVEVQLNLTNDHQGSIQVTADRPETLHMLKGDSGVLQRALNDAGIKTDAGSLSFNLRGDGNGQAMQFADYQAQQQRAFETYTSIQPQPIEDPEYSEVATYRLNMADGVLDIRV